MRLIDADELLEKYEAYGNTSPIALTFIDDLNDMPTVDTERYGHWKEQGETFYTYCSICGKYGDDTPYCAFCGAKMDEVTE